MKSVLAILIQIDRCGMQNGNLQWTLTVCEGVIISASSILMLCGNLPADQQRHALLNVGASISLLP